ncbi:hypothetical protein BGZ60DRAFT_467347 [Tricladium varicosporioides]|nr:hypothetical protein BGZ60DRAFT_467347 [Hymenoscyphus varicosporioides]
MSSSTLSPAYLAENRGPIIIGINATIQGIAVLVVIARIASRFAILKRIGLDDWTIIVATILATGNIVLAGESVRLGTGKHKQAIPKANVIPAGIYRFATRVIYFLISGTIKLSVCFLYLRIFPTLKKHVLALIAFIAACTIAQELCTVFQCVPVAGVWDTTTYPNARCIDNVAFSYSAAALSVLTDIWTLILPIPTVWGLQILLRKKLVLVGMFSLGMIACIAGIIRMAFLITLLDSNDQPWDTFGTSVASGIEMALAIITSSIPGLKPLFDRLFPKFFPNSSKARSRDPFERRTTQKIAREFLIFEDGIRARMYAPYIATK